MNYGLRLSSDIVNLPIANMQMVIDSRDVNRNIFNNYDVTNVFDKDSSAIMTRIDYVERNESRISFLNII